jgi:hypothetical protein
MTRHRFPGFSLHRCLPCILATLAICASPALRADSAPDIATVPADLRIPDLTNDPPAAGKRVNLKLFANTPPVVLYLPTDWTPEKKFPATRDRCLHRQSAWCWLTVRARTRGRLQRPQ